MRQTSMVQMRLRRGEVEESRGREVGFLRPCTKIEPEPVEGLPDYFGCEVLLFRARIWFNFFCGHEIRATASARLRLTSACPSSLDLPTRAIPATLRATGTSVLDPAGGRKKTEEHWSIYTLLSPPL